MIYIARLIADYEKSHRHPTSPCAILRKTYYLCIRSVTLRYAITYSIRRLDEGFLSERDHLPSNNVKNTNIQHNNEVHGIIL